MKFIVALIVMCSGALFAEWLPVAFESLAYPPLATQAQISGTVRLTVVLNQAGHVSAVHVLEGNSVLARAAEENVRSWRFKYSCETGSGSTDGSRTLIFTYVFKLEGKGETRPRTRVRYDSPYRLTVTSEPQLWMPGNSASQRNR
jgi:TonB family protein